MLLDVAAVGLEFPGVDVVGELRTDDLVKHVGADVGIRDWCEDFDVRSALPTYIFSLPAWRK